MKREIKFRAWTRTGEWDDTGERRHFEMIDGDSLCPMECEPFKDILADIEDEYYVMQYTGLKDKNGREIYEGDVVSYDILEGCGDRKAYTSVVEYGEYGFRPFTFNTVVEMDDWYNYELRNFEVIGNIYENPELLKQS